MSDLIYGRNAVMEALKSGRSIEKLLIQDGASGSVNKIKAAAREAGVTVNYVDKKRLDDLAVSGSHQGVIAYVPAYEYSRMEDIYSKAERDGEEPLVLVLDEIEDPHNLGAIMRTAECAGASGVIIPKRRGAGITETVVKTSAGAVEYLPCVRVGNIAKTIEELKEEGFWICACDMDGEFYDERDLTGKLALVIGNEGRGISRLVKEKCDFTCSIPMSGNINSLNASNAAAIMLYEVRRQRRNKGVR